MSRQKKRRKITARRELQGNASQPAGTGGFGIPWPEPKPDLATAVELVQRNADRPFHLKEIVAEIQQHARIRNPKPQEHIRSLLSESPDLARIPDKERYIPGKFLFRNAAFYLSPTERELAKGILIPGHRFYPFMSFEVAPNQVHLSSQEVPEFPRKAMVLPFRDIGIYHSLLGMSEMLTLCRPTGKKLLESFDSPVEIEVYDLSAFYRAHGFTEGDLILTHVIEYETGRFHLEYAGAQTRLSLRKDAVERERMLEASLLKLMRAVGPEPPLHLLRDAYAHLFENGMDLSKPASPFGPFLSSSQVGLSTYYERPCLVPSGKDPMDFYGTLPQPEYDGRCETIEDLFMKGNLSIDMVYVRAAILEDLEGRHEGKEAVVERILKGRTIPQWDDDDWAFFREELDRVWEETQKRRKALSPNRGVRDLRSRLLEQCDAHLAFLRQLDRMGTLPESLPQDELAVLATLDGLCTQFLEILESSPGRDQLRMMEGHLNDLEERWEILSEQFEAAIEGDEDWEDEDWEDEDEEEDREDEDWEDEDEEDEDWEDEFAEEEIEGPVTTYVFKVKFKYAKQIWRKIEVAEQQTLHHLHRAIQDAIEWDDDHPYSFFMSNRAWDDESEFASPYEEDAPHAADEVTIGELGLKPKQKFLYLFDYGDEHEFEVEVVEVRPNAPSGRYPKLIESKGEAPEQYPEE